MTERTHGYARYRLDGCRCYICGYARSQYDDNRNRAIAYGTWQPYVDATPARAHIQVLQDFDMGTRRIAALAGCDRKRITAIITGRSERGTGPQAQIRPALATAILAVEPVLANLAAHTVMDSTGTVRRLRALVAGGWPQAHIGRQLGISPGNFTATISAERVTVRTALAVRGLYGRLWAVDPHTAGASPGGVTRARRYALAHAWAPGAAWDDDTIDDPATYPNWTGKCGTPEGYNAHFAHQILPACQPCRTARAAARRAARKAAAA